MQCAGTRRCAGGAVAAAQVASSNVLVEKMKRSEREVIQDWLENIFKTWEKTNDLEVTLFKFTPLKRGDANLVSGGEKVVRSGNG